MALVSIARAQIHCSFLTGRGRLVGLSLSWAGRAHKNVKNVRLSTTTSWDPVGDATRPTDVAFQVAMDASAAAALLQAVPESCESL